MERILDFIQKKLRTENVWAGPLEILVASNFLRRDIFVFSCKTEGQQPTLSQILKSHQDLWSQVRPRNYFVN